MEDYCRKCGRYKYLYSGGLCGDCKDAEEKRERQRQREREIDREIAEERAYEQQQELLEQQERHQRELLEQAERHHQEMLDVTLPWYPCSHCGNKTRQDKIKEVDGKKLCGDCADKIRFCDYCGCRYVMSSRKVIYKKDENFVKKSSEIFYNYASWVHPQNEKEKRAYEQYDGIRRTLVYMCPSCYEKSKTNQKEMWDTSHKLKVEYEELKAAKEKADREEEERKEREAERKRREEQARREREEAEEKARKEAEKRKSNMSVSAGCLGVLLLVAILIISYVNDGNMGVAFAIGVGAFVLSILLRTFTSHLFAGLDFAFALSPISLVVGLVCYFVWDVFLVPLLICCVVIFLVFTILSATGVIDTTGGETPIDSLRDFFDRFQ